MAVASRPIKRTARNRPGNDYDFGAPPILKSLPDGRTLLIAAQKSGMVYAIDPDHQGALVWQRRIAQRGFAGRHPMGRRGRRFPGVLSAV